MSHPTFMPFTGRIFVLCFAICTLFAGIPLRAQEGRASINGTVTDQSGAFIEGGHSYGAGDGDWPVAHRHLHH